MPRKYVPRSLSRADQRRALASIRRARRAYRSGRYVSRPKLRSAKRRTSSWVAKFKRKYPGVSLLNPKAVERATGIPARAIRGVIRKGKGAYYSSGSRPGVTAQQWAAARVASVVLGGPARRVDAKLLRDNGVKV